MKHVSVFVTCPDEATAERIARALLAERLVACANLLPSRSLYRWEGRVEDARETVMLLKTRAALAPEVVAAVERLHPYEVPCVVALPLAEGSSAYYDWIDRETSRG